MLRSKPQLLLCLVLTLTVGWLLQGTALSHRFDGPSDPCEGKLGTSLIHITLYQPQFDPDAEYCDQVPRAGNTVLLVDVLGDELRRMPLGVQILAGEGSQHQRNVLSL